MAALTASSAAIATAQSGKRFLGGAIFTSNRAGPLCRCRSLSDFFSASSMKDMGQLPWVSARYSNGVSGEATALASTT